MAERGLNGFETGGRVNYVMRFPQTRTFWAFDSLNAAKRANRSLTTRREITAMTDAQIDDLLHDEGWVQE